MLPEISPKLPIADVLHLIEEARNINFAEIWSLCRKSCKLFGRFKENPNFDNYDKAIKAELLRLCGVFLSFYGIARNLKIINLEAKIY